MNIYFALFLVLSEIEFHQCLEYDIKSCKFNPFPAKIHDFFSKFVLLNIW